MSPDYYISAVTTRKSAVRKEVIPLTIQKMLTAAGIRSITAMLRRADIKDQSWQQWIHGSSEPSGGKVIALAEVLGRTPGEVLDAIIAYRRERRREKALIKEALSKAAAAGRAAGS